jgi:hypothetical protein
MNINELKSELFTDLKCPMGFLEHKGVETFDEPTTAKAFGSSVYFYTNDKEWLSKTPACRVMISNVNEFTSEQHRLVLECPKDWQAQQMAVLKKAAEMAYEGGLLKKACQTYATFDAFWTATRKPTMLSLQTECYARRGRRKLFIPMFDGLREVTGNVHLERGAIVEAIFRWELSESVDDERVHVGFRPKFAAGLCVKTLAGDPPALRQPWSWIDVDFETLTMPMYNSLVVKMPCMVVTEVEGLTATVKPPEEFEKAMQDFHALALADPWQHRITLASIASVGERLMASVKPSQNNNNIQWFAVKQRLLPPKADAVKQQLLPPKADAVKQPQVGVKRLSDDNKDSSFGAKTKRQCISNDTNVHNPKRLNVGAVSNK